MSIEIQVFTINSQGESKPVQEGKRIVKDFEILFQINVFKDGPIHFLAYDPLGYCVVNHGWDKIQSNKILTIAYPLSQIKLSGIHTFDIRDPDGKDHWQSLYLVGNFPETPQWEFTYSLTLTSVGNTQGIVMYIAAPQTIFGRQRVNSLFTSYPCTQATDLDGNGWLVVNPPPFKRRFKFTYKMRIETMGSGYMPGGLEDGPSPSIQFISSEPSIESNMPEIQDMAASLGQGTNVELLTKAFYLVKDTLSYRLQKGEFGAGYAIKHREGDCTEYASLLAAILRARGIGARTVLGYSVEGGEAHAIAEVYLSGHWIPVDITNNQTSFLGLMPNFITILRANWMRKGPLEKCVTYYYKSAGPCSRVSGKNKVSIKPYVSPKVIDMDSKEQDLSLPYNYVTSHPSSSRISLNTSTRQETIDIELQNKANIQIKGYIQLSSGNRIGKVIPVSVVPGCSDVRSISTMELKSLFPWTKEISVSFIGAETEKAKATIAINP